MRYILYILVSQAGQLRTSVKRHSDVPDSVPRRTFDVLKQGCRYIVIIYAVVDKSMRRVRVR